MKEFKDIPYGKQGHPLQTLDIYLPDQKTFPTFIYFHGGGFNAGDKSEGAAMGAYLAAHGIALVSANYRIGREAVWPEYVHDAAEAVAWTKAHMREYGICGKFYVGGSSAGGYLSQMLNYNKEYLEPYGIDPLDINGYIHDSGQPTAHFSVLHAKGIDPNRVIVDESAPLYYVGCAEFYSPMMVFVSETDMGNRYEQTLLLVSTLKQFGVPDEDIDLRIMHGHHCEHTFAKDENGESIMGQMVAEFILREPTRHERRVISQNGMGGPGGPGGSPRT